MIVIRADASTLIGTGHIQRCLSLAHQYLELGESIQFVCSDVIGHMKTEIELQGFKCILVSKESEAIELIKKLKPKLLIVDHYGLDEKFELNFKGFCKVLVIDDLADRKHFADYLIDQNYTSSNQDDYQDLVPSSCVKLRGPNYCLLRKSVLTAKKTKDPHSKQSTILCFFGGSDPGNYSGKLLLALKKVQTKNQFQVVITQKHSQLDLLTKEYGPPGSKTENIELLISPKNWDSLLASADLYFGSGGTVTWERLFYGTPGVIVSVASNQTKIAQDLADHKIQIYWGDAEELNFEDAVIKLDQLAHDKKTLQELSEASKSMVKPITTELLNKILNY